MSMQYFEEKICFYQNVFLSFYLNIMLKNILCDVGLKGIKDTKKCLNGVWWAVKMFVLFGGPPCFQR